MSFEALVDRKAFEAGLRTRPVSRTPSFLLHYLPRPAKDNLSTSAGPSDSKPVDKLSESGAEQAASGPAHLLGMMVPKRHARRAVTRNAVKRQARAIALASEPHLASGVWLVRLRAPLALEKGASATSALLKEALRNELKMLFANVGVAARSARSRQASSKASDV